MEFVIKGRLTLERVTFYVSAKTLEGALARAVDGDSPSLIFLVPRARVRACG
jgi:hypothetical protein